MKTKLASTTFFGFCLLIGGFPPLVFAQTVNLTPTPVLPIATPTPTPTLGIGITPVGTIALPPTATPTDTPTAVGITPYPTQVFQATPTPTPAHFTSPLILDYNFFNPFHQDLGIHYDMVSDGETKISIYNMAGELVRTLVNEYKSKGSHMVSWEGHNSNRALVGNGVYLVVFQYPGGQTIQKVILLK